MKIYDETKTEILENPDLKKGYLVRDRIISKVIPAKNEVLEESHIEYKDYFDEDGNLFGQDVIKVVDVPYQPAVPEQYEYEEIYVYILYTEKELAQNRIDELEAWFDDYDLRVKQYERSLRMGVEVDMDIEALDKQADENQDEIRRLREVLKDGN